MSHMALNPSPDVPVNAIWLLRRDQSGRVADTGKGAFVSGRAAPPDAATTNNSQCFPSSIVRLKTTVFPSGEKQGHMSVALASEVMKHAFDSGAPTCELAVPTNEVPHQTTQAEASVLVRIGCLMLGTHL
jgi:hypothetical protein